MDSIQRIKQINNEQASQAQSDLKHHEIIDVSLQTQQIILKSFSTLVDFLENKVTRTEVINQLEMISTPDVAYVVQAVDNLHDTLRTHENTDLTEITAVMRELLNEAKQLPKEQPVTEVPTPIDNTPQLEALVDAVRSVEEVVKQQELVAEAPIVNVPETQVNVDAPDLAPLQASIKDVVKAVKGVIIPEYKTDNKEVEKLLKKSNKLLEELLNKPTGGGGGGGRVSPYEDSAGAPSFVTLASGSIPTSSAPFNLKYDEGATYTYIGEAAPGTLTSAAAWRVKRLTNADNTIVWLDGNADFDNIWDNRAAGAYS